MKRLAQTDYPVVALTHPGMKGKNNEDSFGVAAFSNGPLGARPILLAILSDGVGGHNAGEVASAMAVEQISRVVQDSDGGSPTEVLRRAVQAASQSIRDQALRSAAQSGMAATCACVWINGDRMYTATVGDSRLYRLRGGKIQRISTDHTWVQEALERGLIKPEQVNGHPNQHVIRRYLGSPVPPEVDFRLRLAQNESDERARANQGERVLPGDLILLTSDGLTDLVSDEEIREAFRSAPGEAAGRKLIDLANERGGHDNITLVAVQIPAASRARARRALPISPRWAAWGCGAILLAAVLALGLAGGWWWWSGLTGPPPPRATATVSAQQTAAATVPAGSATRIPPTLAPLVTPSATPAPALPLDSGPTLTPWPTNTVTH